MNFNYCPLLSFSTVVLVVAPKASFSDYSWPFQLELLQILCSEQVYVHAQQLGCYTYSMKLVGRGRAHPGAQNS